MITALAYSVNVSEIIEIINSVLLHSIFFFFFFFKFF
jgi:hypothetical protein